MKTTSQRRVLFASSDWNQVPQGPLDWKVFVESIEMNFAFPHSKL